MQGPKFSRQALSNLAVAAVLLPFSLAASALCITPAAEGSWVNADANTRGNTRAELRFTCQDQIMNGHPFPPGPPWHVHLWGRCHPMDCDWGEVGGDEVRVGDRDYVHATFQQGFATRNVHAAVVDGRLWMWSWTDFKDPNRADYPSQDWFDRH